MKVIDGGKTIEGCTQLLKWVDNYERGKLVTRPIYCEKVTEPGKALCPHHELMLAEASLERGRRAKRAADTKARKRIVHWQQ
jgi:hypothetical protein